MQHPDETFANIHMKTFETYACNMHVYATSRSTIATSRQNTCNISLEQMKHLEHTLETYVYSYYNMCNIPIYFCNIDIQHLQHTLETSKILETYYCSMRFQHRNILLQYAVYAFSVASACCLDRLVDAELDAGMELEATEWRGGHRCRTRRRHGPW
jgi:hypothetical protein